MALRRRPDPITVDDPPQRWAALSVVAIFAPWVLAVLAWAVWR